MAVVSELVQRTRQHLLAGLRQQLNWLNGAVTADATSLVLADDVAGIKPGMVLEVDDETFYVRSVDTGSKTVTVRPGHLASTSASHADDAEVRVAPHYLQSDIFNALLDELRALNGSGVCQFERQELVFDSTTRLYGLDAPASGRILDVYDVTYEGTSPTQSHHRPLRYRVHRKRDTGDFPSGVALEVLQGGTDGHPFTVIVKRTMADFATLADTLDVPDVALPILPVGAAWRLLIGQEARRVNAQAEHGSRRSEEVPAQSNAFAARALMSMRQDLIEDALEAQYREFPPLQKD